MRAKARAKSPEVSVILIFLDAAAFIAEAIESVIGQTHRDWELILVDDGSADGSTDIAKAYAGRFANMFYVDHAGHANRGMSASRNLGLAKIKGDFVAFIDADDLWVPNKLSEQLAILAEHPEVAIVAGSLIEQHGLGKAAGRTTMKIGSKQDCLLDPPDALAWIRPLGPLNAPAPSDVLMRRQAVRDVGGFEDDFPGFGEDAVFFAKLLLKFPAYFASGAWTIHRVHPSSCCSTLNAQGKMREARNRVLLWIYDYARSRPDCPAALVRRARALTRPIRYPVLDLPRRLGRVILPRRLRDWVRAMRGQALAVRFGPE